MWQLGVFGITIGRLNLSAKSDFEGFSCAGQNQSLTIHDNKALIIKGNPAPLVRV